MCRESLINYLASEFSDRTDAYQKVSTEQLDAFGNTARKGQLKLEAEYKPNPFIKKEDIETLINYGELLGENEAVVVSKGKETETYSHKLPESVRKNAKLIDDKLSDILICDPAVGSGAFPVGMMHEIVGARNLLSIFIKQQADVKTQNFASQRTIYNFKRECIEKSLYGVDIDSGAVEIAKLRLWLSLVVDEDDFKEIKPLPNLDYKIVCGNSLLGVKKDLLNAHLFDELEKIKPLHLNETNPAKKQEYKNQIDELIIKLSDGHKDFDFEIYFSEVFHQKKGFDVVIANPPYVTIRNQNKNLKQYIKENYKFSKNADIYVAFLEKGMTLLRTNANIIYIIPNKFFGADYGKGIRNYLRIANIEINLIWDLKDEKVFDALISTIVFSILKKPKQNPTRLIQNNQARIIENLFDVTGKIQIEANDDDNIILNKLNKAKTLLDFADIRTGVMGFEYWKMEPIITSREIINNKRTRIYTNGNFNRYSDHWESEEINLYKKKYEKPAIELSVDYLNVNTIKLFKTHPKILVRGVSKKVAAIIDDVGSGLLVAVHSVLPSNIDDIKWLLGIINSKLINWFHLKTIYSIRIPQGSLKYPVSFFQHLPIIKPINEKSFSQLVNKVLEAKNQNPQANTKHLEDQIDVMVYKLYNLTYEEVEIIDPKIGEIISEEDYDKFEF